jgi:rhodanese-related sulfurtransferase
MGFLRTAYRLASITLGLVLFGACEPAASVDQPQSGGAGETGDAEESDDTANSLRSVKSQVEAGQAVLVDVREPGEWAAGHVDGAVSYPLSELNSTTDPQQLKERLPADKIVYTHCAAGKRSVRAAEILKENGYDVRPITQSYEELLNAGFTEVAQ